MNVVVEAYIVHILQDRVRWYCNSLELGQHAAGQAAAQTPDQAVHALMQCCEGKHENCQHRYLSHSTSCRYEPPDTLVLSYIVCPHAHDLARHSQQAWQEIRLHELQLVHSHHPDDPRPYRVEQHHVLSHALRHLALLTQSETADATVCQSLSEQAKRFLGRVVPALAGQIS